MHAKIWAPANVSARLVLRVLEMSNSLFRFPEIVAVEHYNKNVQEWEHLKRKAMDQTGKYIEHQSQLELICYGKQRDFLSKLFLQERRLTGKENTCEVIAVYNALHCLGRDDVSFPKLLLEFEKDGILLGGYWGSSPNQVIAFLKKSGMKITQMTGREIEPARVEELSKTDRRLPVAYILISFNDARAWSGMVHTICITKEDGVYVTHNDYEGTKKYATLQDAVFGYHGGKGKPMMLLKINE